MTTILAEQIAVELARFSSTTRLYELSIDGSSAGLGTKELLVEAFLADDALNELDVRDLIVVSTNAYLELEKLLGQSASLQIALANGSRTSFTGEISEVAMLGSDGGLARYRVRISPWLWRLGQVRNSRVWQDKTVIGIVDSVFEAYLPLARWRWSDEISSLMAGTAPRSYCCQYRESDLDFIRRILAEEGINWRFEQTDQGPAMLLFADSTGADAVPEDHSSEIDGGIRYHGASAVEHQDTVQSLVAQRRLHASLATVLSYDYKARQIVAANSPTRLSIHRSLPGLETYDAPGQYAFEDRRHAQGHADLRMEGQEARSHLWRGRSTVRTLRPGTRLTITGAPLQELVESPGFTVLRVTSMGVNNLPPPAQHALAELFGSIPELLQECRCANAPDDLALAVGRAVESGYANCFEAVPAALPWRPWLPGSVNGAEPKPTAMGAQSAVVIGPDGNDEPNGADELYCDRLGRIRIRFHWQDSGDASCWVRVAQRAAGGGVGSQFLPRIGQEVLVQFLENDIDRPIVVGALYNGQGEGGIAPTPGGRINRGNDETCFGHANDHAASAQGNLAGAHSPVWHGASGDSGGHRNTAAQWGVRSKEFGGSGYNQLVFDDTDAQGRIQLKCTHVTAELSLEHLIHSADNYRGSVRGLGAGLHTDAYGAVRAAGLLVTSYGATHDSARREPAGENTGGFGVLRQAASLAASVHSAATTHQAVGFASHKGAMTAHTSVLDDKNAPLEAMLTSVSGMVGSDSLDRARTDAAARTTNDGDGNLPHASDPIMTFAANDDFSATAGQSFQLANGETLSVLSGQDVQFVDGGQSRLHTGQAIGALAGAVKAGEQGLGLQMIAAADAIDIQSQADGIAVQARDEVTLTSVSARIDLAAAKRLSLSTAGGANITIEGGNITLQCPGKLTAHGGKKSFSDPAKLDFEMPALPRSICIACLKKSLAAAPAFTMVE